MMLPRRVLLLSVVMITLFACGPLGGDEDPAPYSLSVTPAEVGDSAPTQRVVLLVTVEDTGDGRGSGEAVEIAVNAPGADVIVAPEAGLEPGVVGEVTVIPGENLVGDSALAGVRVAYQPEPVATIDVVITGERQGLIETQTVSVGVVPADGFPLDAAEDVLDVFVPWLAENHPELGIIRETEWLATPTKPHWLVVSHYLFFSERWEMGVRWHIMIEPYNWGEIYLRERFVEVEPSLAFKVDSLTLDPTAIYPVEVVEPVWR